MTYIESHVVYHLFDQCPELQDLDLVVKIISHREHPEILNGRQRIVAHVSPFSSFLNQHRLEVILYTGV